MCLRSVVKCSLLQHFTTNSFEQVCVLPESCVARRAESHQHLEREREIERTFFLSLLCLFGKLAPKTQRKEMAFFSVFLFFLFFPSEILGQGWGISKVGYSNQSDWTRLVSFFFIILGRDAWCQCIFLRVVAFACTYMLVV
jgi:hypothetical protein